MKKLLLFLMLVVVGMNVFSKNDKDQKIISLIYKSSAESSHLFIKSNNETWNSKIIKNISNQVKKLEKELKRETNTEKQKKTITKNINDLKFEKEYIEKNGILLEKSNYFHSFKYIEIFENNITFYVKNNDNEIDDNNGSYYKIKKSGNYFLEDGNITEYTDEKIQFFYKSDAPQVYIHYNLNNKGWTNVPGVKMEKYNGLYTITLPGNNIEFVFNDGNNNWDNYQGKPMVNYNIDLAGVYLIENSEYKYLSTKVVSSNEVIGIYYKTEWEKAFVRYNSNDFGFINELVEMDNSEAREGYKYVAIPYSKSMNFTFTDGNNKIDYGGSYGYIASKTGLYIVENKAIKEYNDIKVSRNNKRKKDFGIKVRLVSRHKRDYLKYNKISNKEIEININKDNSEVLLLL